MIYSASDVQAYHRVNIYRPTVLGLGDRQAWIQQTPTFLVGGMLTRHLAAPRGRRVKDSTTAFKADRVRRDDACHASSITIATRGFAYRLGASLPTRSVLRGQDDADQ